MVKLSIIVAVYNEEDNIKPLIDNITSVFMNTEIDYEVIFVDDGSKDKTAGVIKENTDEKITLVELKRNFGQTAAIKAGIDCSTGDYIATLDGDLQNDPVDLLPMLDLIRESDCDVVTGIRADRKDDFFLRKIPSYVANYFVQKVTHTNIKDNGCGIKIFKADVLKEMPLYGERHRFLVSLAALDGATIRQITVTHHRRVHGKSKYGLGRTLKVVSDLILISFLRKYAQKPMYLFGTAGVITSLSGAAILLWLLIQKLLGEDIWGRPVLILGVLLMFTGFQIISTGFILDMGVRRDYEANSIKPYKIKRISGGKKNNKRVVSIFS